MKILAIRGKNLASLEGEFEVDFRQAPLSQAGLMAITGSTGSGKTTILDAMCIALYGTSPRLESIKNSNVIETCGTATLQESDPKTILRRGTVDGYAEVEFKAINGNEYCVRWSVSRRNNSPNGSFRPTSYDLHNLTDGTHTPLSNSEFKKEIPLLVGLTYEQFTRAVLLAQGNFAVFLKANENEKATILQTLTGTEIYSRISAAIYERHSKAKQALEQVKEKKDALVILTKEELQEISEHNSRLTATQEENEKHIKRLATEKEWLLRSIELEKLFIDAQQMHADAKETIELLRPTAERLALIDSVQEIRDTYTRHRTIAQQRSEGLVRLQTLATLIPEKEKLYADSIEEAKKAQEEQEAIYKEYSEAKPRITEAVGIEALSKSNRRNTQEALSEQERLNSELKQQQTTITLNEKIEAALHKEEIAIREWFKANEKYESIIPFIPGIITNITATETALLQIQEREKLLNKAIEHLAANEERLAIVRKREEELSKTLSSEIAELRKRLVDGEPCPVCGSRHHKTVAIEGSTLAEKELRDAQVVVAKEIEHLSSGIENYKKEISRQESAIETYKASIENFRESNNKLAQNDESRSLLAQKDALTFLTELQKKWKEKNERVQKVKEESILVANNLENSRVRATELQEAINEKKRVIVTLEEEFAQQRKTLLELLGKWQSTCEAEKYFSDSIAAANKATAESVEKRVKSADEYNKLKGKRTEIERLLEEQEKSYNELSASIAQYLLSRKDNIDSDTLDTLMSVDSETVATMRNDIEKATKAVTTAVTTLEERARSVEAHKQSVLRPADGVRIEDIELQSAEAEEKRKNLVNEISSLNAKLLKNKENNALFAQYNEEFERRQTTATHWGELNSLFGSAKGEKLMRLTQGYTLDILLDVANTHLKEFSGRYMLSRISSNSLGIKVIDLDMMSDSRSVHTLSGGETFIASLALSLALSTISSNKMSIESLFIDEGFGALDSDTLRCAMGALEQLQGEGRKICVISHLNEMLERIPTKIRILKKGLGKSKIEIIGNNGL